MKRPHLPGKGRFLRFFPALFLLPLSLSAQNTSWQYSASSGLWSSSDNWTNGVPSDTTDVNISGLQNRFIQVNGDQSFQSIVFNSSGYQINLLNAAGSLTLGSGNLQNGGNNSTVRIEAPVHATGALTIYNSGMSSAMILGNLQVDGNLSLGSGPSLANIYISKVNSSHNISISPGGTGTIDLGLGKDLPSISLGSGVGTVRIHSIEAGYHGNISSTGSAIVDLATDYTAIAAPTSISAQSLQVSGEGKILVRSDRAAVTTQNLIMAGGELVRGGGSLSSLQTLRIKTGSASTITFENSSSPGMNVQNLTVDDRTGALLIRGASLGTGNNHITLQNVPTLSGSGTVNTPTVGILKQVIVDSNLSGGGKDFATYEVSSGVRALKASEYSSTISTDANVRMTANSSIGGNITINSLIIDGGRTFSASAPVTVTSGMVMSTGGTNTINAPLTAAGDLSFFTSSDLILGAQPNPVYGIVKYGSGALTYDSSSGFSKLTVNDGTFKIITGSGSNGNVTINSGGTFFSHGSGKLSLNSVVTVNEGGTWEINNGSIQTLQTSILGTGKILGSGALTNKLELSGPHPSTPTVLSTQLTGNLSLILSGPDVALASSLNDYTGVTQVMNNANIILGADQALSSNSVLQFTSNGALVTNGRSATIAGLVSDPFNGSITGASGDAYSQLEIRVAAGQEYSFNGTTTGNLNITKTGDGKQTLSSSLQNTNLRVEKGTLQVSGQFANAGQTISVGSAGTLLVENLTGSNQPIIQADAGGIVTRSNVIVLDPSTKQTLSFSGGRHTSFDLLATTGFVSYDGSFNLFEEGSTVSDVLSLNGLDGRLFVMQLSFDPGQFSGDPSLLRMGWRDGTKWVEAYLGNSVAQNQFLGYESWESSMSYNLGDWGIDLAANTVWAVLDHNSDFAVIAVPEPSATILSALGLLLLAAVKRSKVKATAIS